MTDHLACIAKNGILRVAINTGNRALVQQDDGELRGISPTLARMLAEELGVQMHPIVYDGAGKVFADAGNDVWDIGFLAIDPMRAERIAFTRPYLTIEATFAVRAASLLHDIADVDQPGITVLTSTGSAYDMVLTKTLKHAALERAGTPPESFEEFRDGRADAVAGVRASLERAFENDADVRIMPGILTRVEQAMVLPGPQNPAIVALDAFVARAIARGVTENGAD